MERKSQQEQHHMFQYYMDMDPETKADRAIMKDKYMSLAHDIFLASQRLELLGRRINSIGE